PAGDLELSHAETDRTLVEDRPLGDELNPRTIEIGRPRRPQFRIADGRGQDRFFRTANDGGFRRRDDDVPGVADLRGGLYSRWRRTADAQTDLGRRIRQARDDENVLQPRWRHGLEPDRLMDAAPGHVQEIQCVETPHQRIDLAIPTRVDADGDGDRVARLRPNRGLREVDAEWGDI